MNVAPMIELLINSELERFLMQQLRLQNGESLAGTVIEVRPDGRALIDFGRFRALAEVKFPVQAGETLRVRVEEKGQQLRMSLETPVKLAGQAESGGRLVRLEPVPEDLPLRLNRAVGEALGQPANLPEATRNLLQRLGEHTSPLDPLQPAARLVGPLRALLEAGGVLFEKRLEAALDRAVSAALPRGRTAEPGAAEGASAAVPGRPSGAEAGVPADGFPALRALAADPAVRQVLQSDLKAALLQLVQQLDPEGGSGTAPAVPPALRELAATLLEDISRQQRQAADPSAEAAVFTFQLPLAGSQRPARLKVYFSKRDGKRSKSGFRLALLLVLERLGELRTDFLMAERKLSITFYTASGRAADLIEAHLEELRASLAGLFAWLAVQVRVDGEKVAAFDSEDWAGDGRLVDLRA